MGLLNDFAAKRCQFYNSGSQQVLMNWLRRDVIVDVKFNISLWRHMLLLLPVHCFYASRDSFTPSSSKNEFLNLLEYESTFAIQLSLLTYVKFSFVFLTCLVNPINLFVTLFSYLHVLRER